MVEGLRLVGVNHRTAPIDVRERFSYGPEEWARAGEELGARGFTERVVLSTCNRSEIYVTSPEGIADVEVQALLEDFLVGFHRVPRDTADPHLYQAGGTSVARHLFRVASSLDSMVVGESEILRQVRTAHESALEQGWTGPTSNRLFRHAVQTGKRVRAETGIGTRPASIATAAVDLAGKVFGSFDGRTACIVGAGEMAERIAHILSMRGVGHILVANRTPERAEKLGAELGRARIVSLEEVESVLVEADVVVSSTASIAPVITEKMLRSAMRLRNNRPLFVVDIAVPRDVEPSARDIYNVFLYHVDDLQDVIEESNTYRRSEAIRAEEIVEGEVRTFVDWVESRQVVPALEALRRHGADVAEAETARVLRRLAHLAESDKRAVRQLARAIVSKLLHTPTVRLKESAVDDGAWADIELLCRLFDLDIEAESASGDDLA